MTTIKGIARKKVQPEKRQLQEISRRRGKELFLSGGICLKKSFRIECGDHI